MEGEYKFRKAQSSREYDEVEGRSWEEIEPLLRSTERDMYDQWIQARGDYGPLSGLRPGLMFAGRQGFSTKKEALDTMVEWTVGRRPGEHPRRTHEHEARSRSGRRRYRPNGGGGGPNPKQKRSAPKIFRPSEPALSSNSPASEG